MYAQKGGVTIVTGTSDHHPEVDQSAHSRDHGEHGSHGDHAAMFRRKFWGSLALTVPIVSPSARPADASRG